MSTILPTDPPNNGESEKDLPSRPAVVGRFEIYLDESPPVDAPIANKTTWTVLTPNGGFIAHGSKHDGFGAVAFDIDRAITRGLLRVWKRRE